MAVPVMVLPMLWWDLSLLWNRGYDGGLVMLSDYWRKSVEWPSINSIASLSLIFFSMSFFSFFSGRTMGLLCFLLQQCRKWHRERWRLWLRFNTSLHSTCWPTMAVISPPPVSTWTQCTANSMHFLSNEQMKVLAMTPTSCITVGTFLRMATGLFQVSLYLFRVCFVYLERGNWLVQPLKQWLR